MVRTLVAGLAAAAALASPASAGSPVVRSATATAGHINVTVAFGDLTPALLVVSTSPRRASTGALSGTGIKLRERIASGTTVPPLLRYRTRARLRPGTYYVQVSGVDSTGMTDCLKPGAGCGSDWSNIRRVVIRST